MKRSYLRSPAGLVLFLTWLLFGMYYACRFNFSPMIPFIKSDLGITNAQAGWFMAFFFISYTACQIPSGYIGDRFGPRKALAWGALISIGGNLIFSRGETFAVLSLGQFVNGMGQAMGWNSAIKMIVNWFPRKNRATAIGLFVTCVTAGSSFGIGFSGYLGDFLGWRSPFVIMPVLLALAGIVFFVFARDNPQEKGLPQFEDEIHLERQMANDSRSTLARVVTHKTLWMVGLVYFCFVYVQFGCLVWIPTLVKETYALSVDRASTISSLVLLPGVFAAPLGGYLSDHYFKGRRKPLIVVGMAVLSLSTLLLGVGVEMVLAIVVLSIVGLMIILPDILLASFPSDVLSRKLAATGMGFLATFTSTAGILSTPLSGKVVDLFNSYSAPFFCFSAMAGLGVVLALFIREKHAQQATPARQVP